MSTRVKSAALGHAAYVVELTEVDAWLWLPTLSAMLCDDCRKHTTADPKLGRQSCETWCGGSNDIVKNFVGYRFVKLAFIAKRPDVELEALQLDAALGGNVVQVQRREIGLSRFWAQASELGNLHMNEEFPLRLRVGKYLEMLSRLSRRLVAEGR